MDLRKETGKLRVKNKSRGYRAPTQYIFFKIQLSHLGTIPPST
jgi:hypothetical protein